MPRKKEFVEDILTLGTGMLTHLVEARHELKSQARQSANSVARAVDLVTREEFDATFAMLAKARDMQEELNSRLERIEAYLKLSSAKSKVKTKNKSLPSVKTKKAKARKK